MKTLVYKDLDGEEFIYNDDTGMIFPYDPKLLYSMEHGGKRNPNEYMDKYYSNLVSSLQSNIVHTPRNIDSVETYLHVNGFSQLTLKVTEQCNMRCEYCIYSEHYPDTKFYSDVYMEWTIAKKAIDDYLSHFYFTWARNKAKKPVIAFYGGEPLLGFEVIKKTVEYVKTNYKQYNVNYSITTNGLLLSNKEISDFLKENEFWIVVSIDGTKSNHDRYRVTRGGTPTYDCLMEIIKENFSLYKSIYSICCYDVTSDLSALTKFYEENDRRKGGGFPAVLRASRINSAFTDFYNNISREQLAAHRKQMDMLQAKYLEHIVANKTPPIFLSLLFSQVFISLSERLKFFNDSTFYNCSCGACVPGDKLFVESDGVYKICEKTNMQGLEIGSTDKGFCFVSAKHAICAYNKCILEKCKDCSCSRLCSLCYASIKTAPTLELDGSDFCERTIHWLTECLAAYTSVAKIKRNPNFSNGIAGMTDTLQIP
jgi:uncharacterized protein